MAEEKNTAAASSKVVTAKSKASKKNRRIVNAGQVHIQATFNNTIISVTDKSGGVLTTSSAGANGFRGSKKGTAFAAGVAAEKALEIAKKEKPDLIILQSRSPSCGAKQIYDGTFSGKMIPGHGVFAELALRSGFLVMDVEDAVTNGLDIAPVVRD